MLRRAALLSVLLFLCLACVPDLLAQYVPPNYLPPNYNYKENSGTTGCIRCHIINLATGSGAHMPEAVGFTWDTTASAWKLSGQGWMASKHAQSNYESTRNTFCARCHSPLESDQNATMTNNVPVSIGGITTGVMEGVGCSVCHPSHNGGVALGRRLGIYNGAGINAPYPSTHAYYPAGASDRGNCGNVSPSCAGPVPYRPVAHGEEDLLCLSCHVQRHNESDPDWQQMYQAGVLCIDCHMAVTRDLPSGLEVRAHDFKVAANLPFSCGVDGSIIQCHPGYSADETRAYLPFFKEQHKPWWPAGGFALIRGGVMPQRSVPRPVQPLVGGMTTVSGNNQTAPVNTTLAPFVVRLTDFDGTPVNGAVVDFTLTGAGRLSSTRVVSDTSGLAQTQLTLGSTAGTVTVKATVGAGNLTVTFTANATAVVPPLAPTPVPPPRSPPKWWGDW